MCRNLIKGKKKIQKVSFQKVPLLTVLTESTHITERCILPQIPLDDFLKVATPQTSAGFRDRF